MELGFELSPDKLLGSVHFSMFLFPTQERALLFLGSSTAEVTLELCSGGPGRGRASHNLQSKCLAQLLNRAMTSGKNREERELESNCKEP